MKIFLIIAFTLIIFPASPMLVTIDNLCFDHCYIIGAIYTSLIVSNLIVAFYIFEQIISIVHKEESNYWILIKVVNYINDFLNSSCLIKMTILTLVYLIVILIPGLLPNWLLINHLLVVTYFHTAFIIIFFVGSLVF